MSTEKIRTALFFAQSTDKLSYYDDWQDAFRNAEQFDVTAFNILKKENISQTDKTIGEYDFAVMLHSTNGLGTENLKPYKDSLKKRKCKLLTFVGNEVNLPHVSMTAKINFIRDTEAEFIGTQLPIEAGRWLFEECEKSEVVPLPHALNPEAFQPRIKEEERKIDIGTRINRYMSHIGDNERERLFDFFLKNEFENPLKVDISSSRFTRAGWANFLNECKGTIATEAGTYYLERDDKTVREIQAYIESQAKSHGLFIAPDYSRLPFLWRVLPVSLKEKIKGFLKSKRVISRKEGFYSVGFKEIFERFFKSYKRPNFYSKCISSRHFDAIGTKTCQIMFEGRYNDILKPDEHYIALKKDFSNIDDVMRRFQDASYRKKMTDHAYEYVMGHHTYKHRMADILKLIGG